MGVSGSGKSTVGAALAGRLRVPFEDADDLHPSANVAKMARGEPLDDSDRWPWLELVGMWLVNHADGGVIACSALKRNYRDQLRHHSDNVEFLLLDGEPRGHRTPPGRPARPLHAGSLISSQLATLEPLQPDERGMTVDLDEPVEQIVAAYLAQASV